MRLFQQYDRNKDGCLEIEALRQEAQLASFVGRLTSRLSTPSPPEPQTAAYRPRRRSPSSSSSSSTSSSRTSNMARSEREALASRCVKAIRGASKRTTDERCGRLGSNFAVYGSQLVRKSKPPARTPASRTADYSRLRLAHPPSPSAYCLLLRAAAGDRPARAADPPGVVAVADM